MKVPMEARDKMRYGGRDMKAGESFRAENEGHANVLSRMGKATYSTRVMTAEKPQKSVEAMSVEELRALAARKGVKVHHRAGVEKLRQALREA